ncbi:DNA polymerase I [Sporolactobacillus inulinus]|jgi:DNA polymerase-1|uniref:DNA polymerase I n=1 Tax=Sporolactobacillus inulinus CASD TaxID=1069536 RepID=A0A0U1QLF7_9BACL|nr:DNA polymerase I [Sporolactobacillus inulinus]KLI01456.1 DNA polymerase I [Sporolactobacillus inulinus CASD]GEB75697.1 DNA polymerase [Sporolactobacillus inulinus]
MNKLVLIDGNNVVYRAFFALPLLSNNQGMYTNAVYGFTMMLMRVIEEEKPTHLLVAFDAGKTTFRHATYKEYKGGRQKTPPELSQQFPLVHELLDAMGIQRYELDNYEADDIVGTLAREASSNGFNVRIVTGDKDYLQLVDQGVRVSLIRKGITDTVDYDIEKVRERYGINPREVIDLKGLMGDASDNIPGVPGVGEKTAIKLLKQFQTVEGVYEHIEQVSGKKLKEKLETNREQALLSKQIATIDRESPLEISPEECSYTHEFTSKLRDLFNELGFHSLLEKIDVTDSDEPQTDKKDIAVQTVTHFKSDQLVSPSALILQMLDENYHYADITGIAVSNKTGTYFIETQHALKDDAFREWLEDPKMKKVLLDSKSAEVALNWRGLMLHGAAFDVRLAAYLIDPSEAGQDLALLANKRGISNVETDEAFYGKGAKQKIPEGNGQAQHLGKKAAALLQLEPKLIQELIENKQRELLFELELPLAHVLAKMEYTGIKTSSETLKAMGEELDRTLEIIEHDIYSMAGVTFNINSPKQLGEILFEKLQLPPIKKTKTGYSTAADVLEKLRGRHEIIDKILDYRQLGKLKSTYVEGLLKVINPETGRVHTVYNQALTQTGRLSSTDPNLQNIPIRLEEGRKIRKAFLPSEEGWQIFSADYSQIELRVLAHIADDENLKEAFLENMDIHTKTAMDVFGVAEDEVTPLMRRHAKAVNFGIVYGISDYGLSQNLGITRKEAAQFIEQYLKSYPGVHQYMRTIVQKAKTEGYVTTLLNRRRYLPEINSRNFNRRSFAERTAMNTPIQGSAADVIKQAMIHMDQRIQEEKLQTRMLLQVHDELIFEVPEHELDIMNRIVPEVMEHAIELRVPLKVECSYGPTWYDAK